MKRSQTTRLVADGAIGGLLAGLTVAFWFLVSDTANGAPLATPQLLAETVLNQEFAAPTFSIVATYTVLHFGMFVGLGIIASLGLFALGMEPQLRYGVVFGLGVLNTIHYGALLATGQPVLTVLPGWQVLTANLLAGMVLMFYLHRAHSAELPFGLSGLREHPVLSHGLGLGVIGALTVALWFLLVDTIAGRPLFTPAALGSATFLGATGPDDIQTTAGIVAAYTMLHVMAFAAAGIVLAWGVEMLEKTPGLWLLALMTFIVFEAGFIGIAGALGSWVLGSLGWLPVLAGNLLAAAAMGTAVWRSRPALRRQFTQKTVPTMV